MQSRSSSLLLHTHPLYIYIYTFPVVPVLTIHLSYHLLTRVYIYIHNRSLNQSITQSNLSTPPSSPSSPGLPRNTAMIINNNNNKTPTPPQPLPFPFLPSNPPIHPIHPSYLISHPSHPSIHPSHPSNPLHSTPLHSKRREEKRKGNSNLISTGAGNTSWGIARLGEKGGVVWCVYCRVV